MIHNVTRWISLVIEVDSPSVPIDSWMVSFALESLGLAHHAYDFGAMLALICINCLGGPNTTTCHHRVMGWTRALYFLLLLGHWGHQVVGCAAVCHVSLSSVLLLTHRGPLLVSVSSLFLSSPRSGVSYLRNWTDRWAADRVPWRLQVIRFYKVVFNYQSKGKAPLSGCWGSLG
jgi:hypothetical protein